MKKQRNAKENIDPFRTPDTASNHKVSASFIFSSCKKKELEISNFLPGHSILVGDSSDEEFITGDSFADIANTNQNGEVVDESLVEYSLIRKWLQNADDSFSSVDDSDLEPKSNPCDNSSTNQEILSRVCKLKDANRETVNNTIVLSSGDESFDLDLGKILV